MWRWLFLLAASAAVCTVSGGGAGAARLVCYIGTGSTSGYTECTHLVYTGDARGEKLEELLKEYRKDNPRIKILLRVADVDKDLRALLKSKHIQGLEVHEAHKTLNKTKVSELVESARNAISSSGGGPLFLALPAHPELLAKYYDLRTLVKKADLMMVQTHDLGHAEKVTYHPSRLSGLWDMMNTDSVVDLVIGLGVPSSKIVISLPATARQFKLVNASLSTPGSPAEDQPKEIDQGELCRQLQKGRWTLERDQDLSAPYAFQAKTWISFEDSSSVDVKGKYARVRGLAGLALHGADRDLDTPCGPTLKAALSKVLNQQSRAPRAAVLRSLEYEILSAPHGELQALQVSPYRITQVVDSDGVIHSIREDTRTEFSCSRQGYFVHPRSCARFYRCVKFDQLSPEFTVFEFDCPSGLAFDGRHEVCVWPGSLPHSQACPGSSEIAPVPKARFQCPGHEGYYADPENCRWFFACLDHGEAGEGLTAYEFRCPFGLGFDAARLTCDWPWLVPACGNIARYEAEAFGFSGAALTGAAGFHGLTADAVNVAAHNSLVSGASLNNLVGIQNSFLTNGDALDSNFIASQELAGLHQGQGSAYQLGAAGAGFVQPTKYTSGSIILDDYRLPTKQEASRHSNLHTDVKGSLGQNLYQPGQYISSQGLNNNGFSGLYSNSKSEYNDESGKYVHDPTGDHAEPYRHIDGPVVPYIHDDQKYKHTGDYYDVGRYSGKYDTSGYAGKYDTSGYAGKYDTSGYAGKYDTSGYAGKYDTSGYAGKYDTSGYSGNENSGQYVQDNSGTYKDDNSGSYNGDTGSYKHDNSGQYVAGVYRNDGHIGTYNNGQSYLNAQNIGTYSSGNAGNYLSDSKAYTGASHTLTAGAINVGLVGKTTLVDAQYIDQGNYKGLYNGGQSYSQSIVHNNGHVPIVSQPAVSINHVGTDGNNLDGYGLEGNQEAYSYVTSPRASVIPTTATPFVTTSVPIITTYKTAFVPEAPKSTIKEIFGYSPQPVTIVHPTVVPVKQVANIQVTDYNQGSNIQDAYQTKSEGYHYKKPAMKFEEGVTYTTPAPVVVSTFKPQGFSHSQQTVHQESGYQYSTPVPVSEEPFKKVVAYTTGPQISNVDYVQPTIATFAPQGFSQQTIHKVESNAYVPVNKVEYTTSRPVEVTYQPQSFSHQTLHNVDASQVKAYDIGYTYEKPQTGINYEKPQSGYTYEKPAVAFVTPQPVLYSTPAPVIVSTIKSQSYSQQTYHQVIPVSTQSPVIYQQPVSVYQNPILQYVQQVTPAPQIPAQSFSQQTIHKVYSNQISTGSSGYRYEVPKTIVQFENVTPAPYVPAQSFSQQTIHKVESNQVSNSGSGYRYDAPKTILQYEKVTAAPYVPAQSFSQQTIHNVESQRVSNVGSSGYQYEAPKTVVQYENVTPTPYAPAQSFSQQTIHKVESNQVPGIVSPGYQYEAPKTIVQYENVTPAPYFPAQSFSQQTIHNVESNQVSGIGSSGYHYETPKTVLQFENVTPAPYVPAQSFSQQTKHNVQSNQASNVVSSGYQYEAPKSVVQYENVTPASYLPAQSFSQQTIHKVETNLASQHGSAGYQSVNYEAPQTVIQYTTPQPTLAVQPVVSTYQPQVFSQQTLHNVDTSKVTFGQEAGYNYEKQQGYSYEKPSIQFEQAKTVVEYSTSAPKVTTYRPESYNLLTLHKIESNQYIPASTAAPKLEVYHQPAVSLYENPILKYTQDVTPKPTTVVEQNYQPIVQNHQVSHVVSQPQQYESTQQNLEISQGYSYSQPEIQRDVETFNNAKYSDASLVSHQVYHLYNTETENKKGKDVIFVSTTPANLVYEDHYSEYDQKKPHQAQEYQQNSYIQQTQDQVDYKPEEYSQQYDTSSLQQVAFSTSHGQPKQVESFRISSYPEKTITTKYHEESPEIQVGYKAEEYLPPVVVSTQAPVSTTYRPRTYATVSTTREYLPPSSTPTYLPPVSQSEYNTLEYLPPSTTVRPVTKAPRVKSTTFKAPDYLPPAEEEKSINIVNLESFGYNQEADFGYNPYQEQVIVSTSAPIERQKNIVIETSKSNLLGFGTVGPDAGLVSPVSYTTSAPIISSTYAPISSTYAQEVSSRVPARRLRPKYKSSTQSYVESTTFKAPEYLPPSDESEAELSFDSYRVQNVNGQSDLNSYEAEVSSTAAPLRQQNIVIQTAKANQLGFGTVGSDAGLVSPISDTPSVSSEYYEPQVTSTYAPIKQELVEVSQPVRRTKPKVAVVTKINDFNPLLVRKLGAVCSCQSPIVILRGRRPNSKTQDYEDNDYEIVTRGDVSDEELAFRSARLLAKKNKPQVTSTFNPIIVPDDSYYQDYDSGETLDIQRNRQFSKNYVSSTTPAYSTTEQVVRIRPRVKAVTVAPNYKTVLLNQDVQEAPIVEVKPQTGGRRDELSAEINCQRAGLFRHPKQCNKFYSCRWDCKKLKFTLHVFNCPVHLSFDSTLGACNWPSQGPACQGDTLLTNAL